jgi:hypothetical protein
LQSKNIELVDANLNNEIREYYNILSRLKAPSNNPLVGLNKNRDYTNMNIYDNIEAMASNSTGVFTTKDIVGMSTVDNIPQKSDKLEEFAKGIKKTMSDQNRLFLIELKDIIRKNTGKVVVVKTDPKAELTEINQILEQNKDDDELNQDVAAFMEGLDNRRTERLKELDSELTDLEEMLKDKQPDMDYTRIEELYKEKDAEYTKIYNEGFNLQKIPRREPAIKVPSYRDTIDNKLIDALDVYFEKLRSEDLTLAQYESLYRNYNKKRDEFIALTGDEEEYPDISDGHERMLRILGKIKEDQEPESQKPDSQKPDEPRPVDSEEDDEEEQEDYTSAYYSDLLDTYEDNSGAAALEKLEDAYIVPSNQESAKLAKTFTTRDLFSLVVRNPNMPIKTVDNYRKRATKRTENISKNTRFYDIVIIDALQGPPDRGIRLIKALEENKLFYDRNGEFYTDNKNDDAKKRLLFEYLVELGNKVKSNS